MSFRETRVPAAFLSLVCDQLKLERDDAALELGCGRGHLTAELARRGLELDAVDRSPDAIQHARTRFGDLPVRWYCEDVALFQMPANHYSAAIAYEAFHLFHEPENILQRIRKSLKPAGRLGIAWRVEEWESSCAATVCEIFKAHGMRFEWGYWQCPDLSSWLDAGWADPITASIMIPSKSRVRDVVSFICSFEISAQIPPQRMAAFTNDLQKAISPLSGVDGMFKGETTFQIVTVQTRH